MEPATIVRDPARISPGPSSQLLHGRPFWALPLSPAGSPYLASLPCPLLPHPSCSHLYPSPAWLSALLLQLPPTFPSSPMPHSSFSFPLPMTPAPASFLSNTLPLSCYSPTSLEPPPTLLRSPSHVEDLPLLSDTGACISSKAPAVSWGIDKDKWYYVKFHLMTNF